MTDKSEELQTDSSFDFPQPSDDAKEKHLVLWATHYYVYSTKAAGEGQPLLDKAGKELGPKLSLRDWCLAAIEGTVRVVDANGHATVYNFAATGSTSQCNCSPYAPSLPQKTKEGLGKTLWRMANGPFGDGVNGMILVPFRSVAVDKSRIPFGSVLYIPRARGNKVTLPSGNVVTHDGYFYAADTGDAIIGTHIDMFGGVSAANPFPSFVTSSARGTFEAFMINDKRISDALGALHHKI